MNTKERIKRLNALIKKTEFEIKSLQMEAKALQVFLTDRKRILKTLKSKPKGA